ncbi:hypothetical protein KI387_036291, partial [Taxus chinensis]
QDRARAMEILVKDLKIFSSLNEELFKEITQLLTLENFSTCVPPNGTRAPTLQIILLLGCYQKEQPFLLPHMPFQPRGAPSDSSLGSMASPNPSAPHPVVATGYVSLTVPLKCRWQKEKGYEISQAKASQRQSHNHIFERNFDLNDVGWMIDNK